MADFLLYSLRLLLQTLSVGNQEAGFDCCSVIEFQDLLLNLCSVKLESELACCLIINFRLRIEANAVIHLAIDFEFHSIAAAFA